MCTKSTEKGSRGAWYTGEYHVQNEKIGIVVIGLILICFILYHLPSLIMQLVILCNDVIGCTACGFLDGMHAHPPIGVYAIWWIELLSQFIVESIKCDPRYHSYVQAVYTVTASTIKSYSM